jgi:hypothetical protein
MGQAENYDYTKGCKSLLRRGQRKQKLDAGLKPGATKAEAESLNNLFLHFDS